MSLYALDNIAPILPEDGRYWIAPGAQVMGKVRLGVDATVWFGAVLRGDNAEIVLGDRSNIQDGTICHTNVGMPLTIGRGCTIGHGAILHGCTIGDGTLIGMGATVLNQAVIGKNSLVGARALVTEGKVFPDGVLIVGSPARVMRVLTPDEIAGLVRSADGYVANGQRFRAGLKPIA